MYTFAQTRRNALIFGERRFFFDPYLLVFRDARKLNYTYQKESGAAEKQRRKAVNCCGLNSRRDTGQT